MQASKKLKGKKGCGCAARNGFTFVELLLTLLVLSLAVLPLIRMFTTAINETTYIDDKLTALDLAREETEKVKNLGLSQNQIEKMGNVISPPIYLNKKVWRTARVVSIDKDPMEVMVYVFQGNDLSNSVVSIATIVDK